MQMDSYHYAGFFHDDAAFYAQHGAVPPSPELPFALIAEPGPEPEPEPPFVTPPQAQLPTTAFPDYGVSGPELEPEPPFVAPQAQLLDYGVAGPELPPPPAGMTDALGWTMGAGDGREHEQQDQAMEEAGPRRARAAGAVESSRGFRHMMRERQRREKLSQSYADLHALVAARSRGDKNSTVQAAAIYIHELRAAREQLRRRNDELKARILGHDARQQCVKLQFEVDDPASGIDSMLGALRRLKSMDVRARGIRSTMSGRRLWTEMNVETTIAAAEVEKAVEEALLQEVERKQQQPGPGSGAAGFPRSTASGSEG